jgi:hypothetical protein
MNNISIPKIVPAAKNDLTAASVIDRAFLIKCGISIFETANVIIVNRFQDV